MPSQFSLNSQEWDRLKDDLTSLLTQDRNAILKEGAEQVGVAIDEIARSSYPPAPRPLKVAQYWTDRQRRWWWGVMSAKAKGTARISDLPGWSAEYITVNGVKTLKISGSYRRSNKLIQSLSYEIDQTPTETLLSYGSNTDYATYVMGDPADPDPLQRQSKYHQGNWADLGGLIQKNLQVLAELFVDTVYEAIQRRLR